jgi:hypothetical protein
MPEGPEVWILSEALNILSNNPDYSKSYGKHLFITNNNKKMYKARHKVSRALP